MKKIKQTLLCLGLFATLTCVAAAQNPDFPLHRPHPGKTTPAAKPGRVVIQTPAFHLLGARFEKPSARSGELVRLDLVFTAPAERDTTVNLSSLGLKSGKGGELRLPAVIHVAKGVRVYKLALRVGKVAASKTVTLIAQRGASSDAARQCSLTLVP